MYANMTGPVLMGRNNKADVARPPPSCYVTLAFHQNDHALFIFYLFISVFT